MATKLNFKTISMWTVLGLLLMFLAATIWARFAVSQKAGWSPITWALRAGPALPTQIQAHLDVETRANPNVLGQSLHIIAPRLGLDQTFVSGAGLRPTDSIRIASNIKPFVAAAALKLVEEERLSLDGPLGPNLSPSMRALFRDKEWVLKQTTLRQLLTNTSGLRDYGNSQLFQLAAYVPTAFGFGWPWRAKDQVWVSINLLPIGATGQEFDYSDTNYLLASDAIAYATGAANAGIALRELMDWPALGAENTFWEGYEPTPPNTVFARQFRGLIEDTNLDVSFDRHGGGGLVMTMAALARAHRAVGYLKS
jgi:D-alanyl-D-alanine carboxypeptidase